MEPASGRERRDRGALRRQLRQHPQAGRYPLAARPLHRAVQGSLRRPLADDERRLQALRPGRRSEEHTSELQSRLHLVCRLLLEKKKKKAVTRYKNISEGKNKLTEHTRAGV